MRRFVVQFRAAVFLSIPVALVSISTVWPSYSIKLLEGDESPLGSSLTKLESNLVVAIPYLGSMVTTLGAGWCAEAFGRKNTQIISGLLFIVSWSLITTARSSTSLLMGRLVAGMSGGLSIVNVIVYITEITELKIRSSAITLVSLMYNIGTLVSYLLGWFCSYQVICYFNVITSVGYVLLVACFKDSPVYLMKNGLEKEGLIALKFYRGAFGADHTTEAIIKELADIKKLLHTNIGSEKDLEKSKTLTENEKLCKEQKSTNADVVAVCINEASKNPWILLLSIDYNRRALFTLMSLMGLCVSLGMIAVQAYAGSIFIQAVPNLSPDLCSVLLAVVLSSGFTVLVTDLVSRRFLMLSTCTIATVCLAVLGTMLRWSWGPVWVSPVAILVYSFCFHLGCINIVLVQLGECFAPQVNSAASSMVICVMFISNFLVLFIYAPALDILGMDGIFFAFSIIGVITTILSALMLKETRRVSIEKIQQMYSIGYIYRHID